MSIQFQLYSMSFRQKKKQFGSKSVGEPNNNPHAATIAKQNRAKVNENNDVNNNRNPSLKRMNIRQKTTIIIMIIVKLSPLKIIEDSYKCNIISKYRSESLLKIKSTPNLNNFEKKLMSYNW